MITVGGRGFLLSVTFGDIENMDGPGDNYGGNFKHVKKDLLNVPSLQRQLTLTDTFQHVYLDEE